MNQPQHLRMLLVWQIASFERRIEVVLCFIAANRGRS